jgi:hypothetical protein
MHSQFENFDFWQLGVSLNWCDVLLQEMFDSPHEQQPHNLRQTLWERENKQNVVVF